MRQWTRGAREGGDVPNDDRVVLRGGPNVAAGGTAIVVHVRVFAAFGEEARLWAVARRAGPDRHGDRELTLVGRLRSVGNRTVPARPSGADYLKESHS